VVGNFVGLGDGIRVGSADNGVGSRVVGSNVGLGVGMVEGIALGVTVGIIVGEGVVGEGVITFVGRKVGAGVGIQVVQSNFREISTPPDGNPTPLKKAFQIFSPIGGLKA